MYNKLVPTLVRKTCLAQLVRKACIKAKIGHRICCQTKITSSRVKSFSYEFFDFSRHFSVFFIFFLLMEMSSVYFGLHVLPKNKIESQLAPKIIKNSSPASAREAFTLFNYVSDGRCGVSFVEKSCL